MLNQGAGRAQANPSINSSSDEAAQGGSTEPITTNRIRLRTRVLSNTKSSGKIGQHTEMPTKTNK